MSCCVAIYYVYRDVYLGYSVGDITLCERELWNVRNSTQWQQ